jgi:hypothetical protein
VPSTLVTTRLPRRTKPGFERFNHAAVSNRTTTVDYQGSSQAAFELFCPAAVVPPDLPKSDMAWNNDVQNTVAARKTDACCAAIGTSVSDN